MYFNLLYFKMNKFNSLNSILIAAIVYHFLIAVFIHSHPLIRNVTGLQFVYELFGDYDRLMYILACVFSIASIFLEKNKSNVSLILIMFQQNLLMISFMGEFVAVYRGTYPDGYIPNGGMLFILIDQFPAMALFILHTIVVAEKWQKKMMKK